MARPSRVLVVGTTPDYVDWIRRAAPDQALFLTDRVMRESADENRPNAEEELTADLWDFEGIHRALGAHLNRFGFSLDGVACFDCESLELAARLATLQGLSFPTIEAVRFCRNKHLAKQRWHEAGVPTARAILVDSAGMLRSFVERIQHPCVIKPLTGSGSELVFICRTPEEADLAFGQISEGLADRQTSRMYEPIRDQSVRVMAEEYLEGPEFSCDFLVEGDRVALLRFTRKLPLPGAPLGVTRAYVPADCLGGPVPAIEKVAAAMATGAQALGLDRTICMADFILCDDEIMLLEMTPRLGGDCLPHLALTGAGIDMLRFAIDYARRPVINGFHAPMVQPCIGLRLFSQLSGEIDLLDASGLIADPRVRQTHLIRRRGHRVQLPPEDYESWLLGHVIFKPDPVESIASQCDELAAKLIVRMKNA